MPHEENDIDTLIARWLADELSDPDRQQFEVWINVNPEKAAELVQLKAIWKFSDFEKLPENTFEKRWESISNQTTVKQKKLPLLYKLAASFAGIILVGTFLFIWLRAGEIIIETKNAVHRALLLPDSSSVTLNAASTLKYNPRLWFFSRKVTLAGEAFFSVVKSGSPFTVVTRIAETQVLGTSFNVRERNDVFSVACVTGRVGVSPVSHNETSVVLEKGDQCQVRSGKITTSNFDVTKSTATAWMNQQLFFSHAPLQEVFDEVSRFYDVTIDYSGTSDSTFSGTFENASAEEVLNIVSLSASLKVSKQTPTSFIISD